MAKERSEGKKNSSHAAVITLEISLVREINEQALPEEAEKACCYLYLRCTPAESVVQRARDTVNAVKAINGKLPLPPPDTPVA